MKKIFFRLASWVARNLPLSIKQALYRIPWLARFIRGSINASVDEGLTITEVAAGDLKGYKLLLNLKAEKSRWLGTYEPELQDALRADRLGQLVQRLFRHVHARLAEAVLAADDTLDSLKTQIFRELLTYMLQAPETIEPALDLILVSRHLERIGDHATNIAEEVVYIYEAQDIRHSGEGKSA